ncbi:MAG: HIG1 domain-containing protein [Sphingobium sp.]|nr:HIG1 domain-containing protein [Sphingobium sp.]
MGNVLIVILIAVLAIGAVVSLVRGVIAFLRTTEEDLKGTGSGPSQSSLKQNKMMMARLTFQAGAILLVALLLLLNSGR